MITEMDRIKMIIAEGAKKGLELLKFIDLQIDDFKQSDTFKEMVEGSKYYKNQVFLMLTENSDFIRTNSLEV